MFCKLQGRNASHMKPPRSLPSNKNIITNLSPPARVDGEASSKREAPRVRLS